MQGPAASQASSRDERDSSHRAIELWSQMAAVGAIGILAGGLWPPLGACGFLLFLLSLFVLRALQR